MDINHCIGHLGLHRNTYRLTQSNPPHEFISWDGPDPQPTQAELDAAWTEIQTASDANAYARTRETAYPSIGDQLDMLWHAVDVDATLKTKYADFHTAIKTVKDANPKP